MTTLRRRMMEDMQVRSLSPQTQATYVQQVALFARHFNRSPELLGPEEIRSYEVYLTNERKARPKEPYGSHSNPQETPEAANCPQSGRSSAVFGLCVEYQASHDPDHLLRGRAARLRGCLSEGQGYR